MLPVRDSQSKAGERLKVKGQKKTFHENENKAGIVILIQIKQTLKQRW